MVDLVSLNNGNPMNRSVPEIGYPPHPGLKPLVSREGLMGTFSSISGLYYEAGDKKEAIICCAVTFHSYCSLKGAFNTFSNRLRALV